LIWRILLVTLSVFILTVVSQIGGAVLLITLLFFPFINKKIKAKWIQAWIKVVLFILLYFVIIAFFVPPLASFFGRVPLPVFRTNGLQPLNLITCVLNRHYVKPQLRETILQASFKIAKKHPGSMVNYLDANFPFIDKFPLLPHLSHNDGRKLDLAFMYRDTESGEITSAHPSFIGYGICEEPYAGELNMPEVCERKGFEQYSFLKLVVPQNEKKHYIFDDVRTRALVQTLTDFNTIGKIFIEPHLRQRLKLTSAKIRYHGCQAVRHDDHIHIQLK
jgi:energy-coupling factor transporter transmembrane protein EcfT